MADAPAAGVAVVFGAGLWKGEPSPYLARRLDAAVELYRAGKVRAVLVTGDNSRTDYDEPDAMRGYLVAHGVPDTRVVSRLRRLRHLGLLHPGQEDLRRGPGRPGQPGLPHPARGGAVRGRGHRARTASGVDAAHDVTWYYGGAREVFAADKAAVDAVFQPDPTFLGPKEPGRWPADTGGPARGEAGAQPSRGPRRRRGARGGGPAAAGSRSDGAGLTARRAPR